MESVARCGGILPEVLRYRCRDFLRRQMVRLVTFSGCPFSAWVQSIPGRAGVRACQWVVAMLSESVADLGLVVPNLPNSSLADRQLFVDKGGKCLGHVYGHRVSQLSPAFRPGRRETPPIRK